MGEWLGYKRTHHPSVGKDNRCDCETAWMSSHRGPCDTFHFYHCNSFTVHMIKYITLTGYSLHVIK